MAMAAAPMTPVKENGDQEGGPGNEQQDKEQAWEGMEPLGGAAAGQKCCSSCSNFVSLTHKSVLSHRVTHMPLTEELQVLQLINVAC